MSETEQREVEIVTGTIKGVIVKGIDKWQVEVQPDGSEYTKKLWTKDAALIEAMPAKIGQSGAFVCNASYWTNNENKQVRSLWISGEAGSEDYVPSESPARVATPAAAPQAKSQSKSSSESLSKDEWARKDSAADKRACIAIAVSALTHTMPADPTPEDLSKFIGRVKFLSSEWHTQVNAVRGGSYADDDVPF